MEKLSEFFLDNKISLKAKGMVSVILSQPKDWKFTINRFASLVNEGNTAIRSAIKELQDAGYCCYRNCYENGRIKGCEYYFSYNKADVVAVREEWEKEKHNKI